MDQSSSGGGSDSRKERNLSCVRGTGTWIPMSVSSINIPCKFYLLGGCSAGKSCKYLHIKNNEITNHSGTTVQQSHAPDSSSLVCSYYLKGSCKYGSRCIFRHSKHEKTAYSALKTVGESSMAWNAQACRNRSDGQYRHNSVIMRRDSDETDGESSFDEHDDDNDNSQNLDVPFQNLSLSAENRPKNAANMSLAPFPYPLLSEKDGVKEPLLYSCVTKGGLDALASTSASFASKGGNSFFLEKTKSNPHSMQIHNITNSKPHPYNSQCSCIDRTKCQCSSMLVQNPSNEPSNDHRVPSLPEDRDFNVDTSTEIDQKIVGYKGCLDPKSVLVSTTDLECGICLEPLIEDGKTQFGLLNCDHIFCLDCIRSWRASQSIGLSAVRSCPICRLATHFITPSHVWTTDPEKKIQIIRDYKAKLKSIPCKYFRDEQDACPFGSSCFYAHLGRDGKPVEASKPKICLTASNEIKFMTNTKYFYQLDL